MQNWILALAASPLVYLGMYLFAAIDGFFPPIPSESFAATGAFTGDQIAYTIGKRLDVRRIPFMGGPRGLKALDWAGRSLELRGASVILAARYIPVGRVAVNVTAGAVGYPRRRFVGFDAIASLSWALYSAAIGVGAGEWFKGHPFGAVLVGLAGGLLIGLVLDWILRRLSRRKNRAGDPAATHPPPRAHTRRPRK